MSTAAPMALLPYQAEWVADQSQVKIIEKSRRVGISWSEAAAAVLTAAAATGTDVLYIGYSKDMAAEFVRDAADWAEHFQIAVTEQGQFLFPDDDDGTHSILSYRISFASGFRIMALSSRPTSLRGKQGRVVIDEAAFHKDLPGLLKAAIALLMWGGAVHIISTHDGIENPFNELIEECRAGKKNYSVHRVTLDEALSDCLYKRICLVTGKTWTPEAETAWRDELLEFYGDSADEELHVVPSSGTGTYLHRDVIRACMREGRPVLRLSLDDAFATQPAHEREATIRNWITDHLLDHVDARPFNFNHYLGEDFGRSGDLTVLAPFSELEALTYSVPFTVELRNVPFDQQRQIVFWLLDHLPNFRHAAFDAGGNGSYLAEVASQRYHGRISCIKLTQKWYLDNMPKLKDALEGVRLELPQHADILADLRAIERVNGIPTIPSGKHNKGTDGKPRHGDSAMSIALGWYACHVDGAPAAGSIQTKTPQHAPRRHFGRLK